MQSRARLFAGFLAAHLALIVPLAPPLIDWAWPTHGSWLRHLNLDREGSPANLYSGILWGIVAALAAAQLLRPVVSRRGPRWLWPLGWLSVALFAALVAVEELADVKDALGGWDALSALLASVNLADLPVGIRWAAVVTALTAPLLAAAAWVLYTSLRRRPTLALLTALALALAVGAALRDGFSDLYGTTAGWELLIEDGSELMAAAILAVVFVEMLAAGRTVSADDRSSRGARVERWAALGVTVALVGVGVPALLAQYKWEEAGWTRPLFYAGPIFRLEQPFQTNLDGLTRIDVWGYVDGGDGASGTAVILAHLMPHEGGPAISSHAQVRGDRSGPAINVINFEPIPDSRGKRYDLVILSEPFPRVHLGLTGSGASPHGAVIVNDVPHERRLAMGTHAVVRGGEMVRDLFTRDPRRLFVVGDVIAMLFLWVFAVVATWRGLAGPQPRFWRRFVWPVARRSALVTVGLLVITLAVTTIV